MNPPPTTPRVHREVVSFVRRSTRMRANQRAAWERYGRAFLLEVDRAETSISVAPQPPIDLTAAFGRTAPVVVEIGPGTGESLIPMAQAMPEINILAFEVYQPALARILAGLGREGIRNVRLLEADAVEGLRHLIAPGSLAEVWTFFPDPWPKSRHHKRRLIDAEFATLVASRLQPNRHWRLATDWEDYAVQMRGVLDEHPDWVSQHPGVAPRWEARPTSRFEARGIEAGRTIADLNYVRVS